MRNELTKVSRSSQQIAIVRRSRDSILPDGEPRLRPLVPEGSPEEGTVVERRRAVVYWLSTREATRR